MASRSSYVHLAYVADRRLLVYQVIEILGTHEFFRVSEERIDLEVDLVSEEHLLYGEDFGTQRAAVDATVYHQFRQRTMERCYFRPGMAIA